MNKYIYIYKILKEKLLRKYKTVIRKNETVTVAITFREFKNLTVCIHCFFK